MAQIDWTELSDNASQASIPHGVINAAAIGGPPPGGGPFVYVTDSAVNTPGVVALYTAVVGFSPVTKGCDVRGVIQKVISGGASGYSAWLFAQAQGTSSLFNAYMLGLADGGAASHIVLQRGLLSGGLHDNAPGTANSGTLARSTATYGPSAWLQLRLEVVLNTNGDVVLNCYQNDLTALGADVNSPIWTPIPGISQIIDDAVGANLSNLLAANPTAPLAPGFMGFGSQSANSARRAAFAQLQTIAQL